MQNRALVVLDASGVGLDSNVVRESCLSFQNPEGIEVELESQLSEEQKAIPKK